MTTKTIPAGRPGIPNPVDIHVGERIRLRRTILRMSQEKLSEALGLTFQQIQKYERGANRVGASRLYDIAGVLDVNIQFFYDDMPEDVSGQAPRLRAGLADIKEHPTFSSDPMLRKETLELVRAYYRIKDENLRNKVFDLCVAMTAPEREMNEE